ncbi:MAG: hypothetical protein QOG63_1150 [Thermoleophilaceae bacterium]|nr:hypothetical protein [Thermoleophilaceae bacterium]
MLQLPKPRARKRGHTTTEMPRSRSALRSVAGAAVLCALSLAVAPAALADVSASSPGDIGVAISTPGPVLSGVTATYTVTATNNTATALDRADITGQLSPGFTLDGFGLNLVCERTNKKPSLGPLFSCAFATPVPNSPATILPLAPGETASWTFTATAPQPGSWSARINALGTFPVGHAPLGVNNTVNLAIPVTQGPVPAGGGGGGGVPTPVGAGSTDLALTGSASTGSPAFGSPFSYKFQVKNNGRSDAPAATFDDPLPGAVTGTSVSTDTGSCVVDTVTNGVHCDLGGLAAGKQATIVVNATAPTAAGSITNTASTGMTGTDTNPANNSASVTVQPR